MAAPGHHVFRISMDNTPAQVASELRYRRLFETAQDGILILNFTTGKIEDANPFLTTILGYTHEELVGKRLWEIGAIVDKKSSLEAFAVLQDKGYIRYEDLPLMTKSGDIINVEFVSNAYDVNGDRVIQCNIRDITQRKQTDRQLLEYQHLVALGMSEIVDVLSAMIEERDPYTAGHQSRVAHLSVAMATEMQLMPHNIEGIRLSALVHDIGKFSIPAQVLMKPTQLNAFEIAMLKNHVQAGYDVLKHIHFPWPVAQIVLQHHERIDGTGYPNGLKGDSISDDARILAVADTVDAMAGARPYRTAFTIDEALDTLLAGAGTIYDTKVVDVCVRVFKVNRYTFPPTKYTDDVPISNKHL
jgi:PAS domain S-box-containing protein/putative nucleotidyltransferase with HDIG domain